MYIRFVRSLEDFPELPEVRHRIAHDLLILEGDIEENRAEVH